MTIGSSAASTTIPTPPHFPIIWTQPADAQLFWTAERFHFPDPMGPLEFAVAEKMIVGAHRAMATYSLPVRLHFRLFNSYVYQSIAPLPVAPAELERLGAEAEQRLGAILGRLGEQWADEWLPELQQHLADWQRFDLAGATDAALAVHWVETLRRTERLWEIHFLTVLPVLLAMGLFDELCGELFGQEDAFVAHRLIQGLPNRTVESGQALWRLGRWALARPAVRAVLETTAAGAVVAALAGSDDGHAFLTELRAYLDEYGQRADKFAMLSAPSWIEEPTPVIKMLKDYITQPERDLAAEAAAATREREARLATARARLVGYPEPVVGQFEFLLRAAQTAAVLSEDHGFWIDYRGMYQVRRVLLECGRRLAAAGVIAQADDVLYLSPAEVQAGLEGATDDRRMVVLERQAVVDHFRSIQPPPAVGTAPVGPPPDSPMFRSMTKFFGGPPQPPSEPGLLKGNAGSPGMVRGFARVLRSLAEADRLRPGEILVAETTAPPWTPLFATAAAVVTDTGGILSHCAVVAREYGIPAVVGIGLATAVIQDGQLLEVDGTSGTVRLISEP